MLPQTSAITQGVLGLMMKTRILLCRHLAALSTLPVCGMNAVNVKMAGWVKRRSNGLTFTHLIIFAN